MNISVENYWDNTLQACKSALGLLSAFEGDNNKLINNAIEPLQELIRLAPDFEYLKTFHSQAPSLLLTRSKEKGKQALEPHEDLIVYHIDPSWTVIDDRTVHITIESTGTVIVAKTVTTPEELDTLIARMYEIGKASLDCEFIAFKEGLPQLQILQVAVSTTEGYAIIIDKVGIDALDAKLKPCLEDQSMNFVGWAFRSDASAIERTIKGILIAPILDLQAKLRPIAVEEMNLYAGVSKYAPDWDALEEFQKAKLQGDAFDYFEGNCIWLKDPLPPAALVYAVFDVVSLEALVKSTEIYPTQPDHYWPLTITMNVGTKAMNNFHKQRAMNYAAAIVDTKDLKNQNGHHFANKRGHSKNRKSFNNSNQKPYDPDAQYKDDMQKALYLSLQESKHPSTPGYASSSKTEDRVIDSDASELQHSNPGLEADLTLLPNGAPHFADRVAEEEEPVLESTWSDIVNEKQKPFLGLSWISNQDNSDNSKSSVSPVPTVSPIESGELKVTILKRPVEPVAPTSPYTQQGEKTPPSANTNKTGSSQVRQLFDAKPKRSSQDSSDSIVNSLFSSKPEKSSYAKNMKITGGLSNQTGTFGWDDDTYNGGRGKAWKEFAQTAKTGWTNNIDTDPNDIDEIKASNQSATIAPIKPREEVKFKTSSTNVWHNKDILSSDHNEWNVETERPTVMTMPITRHQIRKSKGPRCINPMDTDFSEDDSDQVSDDDDDKNGTDSNSNNTKHDSESSNDQSESNITYYTYNQNQNQWSKWSNQNYSGNQYSRRSSYERNNSNNSSGSNSRSARGSWGSSGEQRSSNYNNNNNNSNRGYNSNYNNNYNSNCNNNRYSHSNSSNTYNSNKRWSNRNSGSSSSSSTPQPTPVKQVITTNTTEKYDELETHVNDLYTNTGDYIKIFNLTIPSHLNQIILPSLDTQFTVAITFHLIPTNNEARPQLKAIQFYLPDNSSFNVLIGKACHENSTEITLNSKFNTLLTHPNINRVAWFPEYFDTQLKEKTGVDIGRVVDLGLKMHSLGDCDPKFISAVNRYLKDWPSLEQFITAKEEYDHTSRKKFVSAWDRDKITDYTLEYSSLQGAALFQLYHHNILYSVPDEEYIYKRK